MTRLSLNQRVRLAFVSRYSEQNTARIVGRTVSGETYNVEVMHQGKAFVLPDVPRELLETIE